MAVGTTPQQDRSFLELLVKEDINDVPLSFVVEWVASEFEPQEVFSEAELSYWAETHGYILEE